MYWRGGREAEGAPLLREYGALNLHRGFESLPLRIEDIKQNKEKVNE